MHSKFGKQIWSHSSICEVKNLVSLTGLFMAPFRRMVKPLSVPFSAVAAVDRGTWDPLVSLKFEHPILVLLEKCQRTDHFKQILAQMIRIHLTTQTFPMSRLLYFSAVAHPECLNVACLLFKHFTPDPNLYIYNIMISALSFSRDKSLNLYKSLLSSHIHPDEHTLLPILKSSKGISEIKQIHVHVIIHGFSSHLYLQNSLTKMYLEIGKLPLAQQVFQYMPNRDIVSYNIMISGHAKIGYSMEALDFFHDMAVSEIKPDQFTIVGLLMCCGQLKYALLGKSIHGFIARKMSLGGRCLILNNALLDMYAKCEKMQIAMKLFDEMDERDEISWNIVIAGFSNIGELDRACKLFDSTPRRNLISWNCLLAGFARKGDCTTMMKLLEHMIAGNVRPDKVTAITLVCAAAEMGSLNLGRCIHGLVVKAVGNLDAYIGSALIDMYCKSGDVERSCVVFRTVSDKDIALWTAMIAGLASHGHGTKALELFWKMQDEGLMPNSVTLLAILTACSHAGLVDEGSRIFDAMSNRYDIEPGVEHYGCMVNLLARSGRLNEALTIINRIPMKPSRSMWGAILSASKTHQNIELAEAAAEELLKLEPEEEGGYVLLYNTYASCGKWNYSKNIREVMQSRGVNKMAGCSLVAVDADVHEFISSDKRHPRCIEIYRMICDLHEVMGAGTDILFQFLQQVQGSDVD